MRRTHIMTVTFVAVLMASMLVVVAASAVEFLLALWLANGEPVPAALSAESEGELVLRTLNSGGLGIRTEILCSGIGLGLISTEGLGYGSEVLTLSGIAVSKTQLSGTPLLCSNSGNCTEPEVWASVPVEGDVVLMIDGSETFLVGLIFNGFWYVQCLVLGVTAAELCEAAESVGRLTNEANGTIRAETNVAFTELAGLKLGNCTVGGAETAELEGSGIGLISGVTLSVSSE
jgi:hypothetical protein